jgi:hypothetical protein
MNNWAVTERVPVRVVLAEGLAILGDAHLQPRVAWRDGPETILEMLNRDEAFFAMTLAGGDVVFVSKAQVAVLAYHEAGGSDSERNSAARTIPLEVMMVGGAEHRGTALSELPPTRGRALDFLNAPEAFFLLIAADSNLCLNRRHVRAARPLS